MFCNDFRCTIDSYVTQIVARDVEREREMHGLVYPNKPCSKPLLEAIPVYCLAVLAKLSPPLLVIFWISSRVLVFTPPHLEPWISKNLIWRVNHSPFAWFGSCNDWRHCLLELKVVALICSPKITLKNTLNKSTCMYKVIPFRKFLEKIRTGN